jgi:plasmid stability protein
MATLNVKNFPDDLYKALQERAQREHRSVTQEVVHLLETSLTQAEPLSILELRGCERITDQG